MKFDTEDLSLASLFIFQCLKVPVSSYNQFLPLLLEDYDVSSHNFILAINSTNCRNLDTFFVKTGKLRHRREFVARQHLKQRKLEQSASDK